MVRATHDKLMKVASSVLEHGRLKGYLILRNSKALDPSNYATHRIKNAFVKCDIVVHIIHVIINDGRETLSVRARLGGRRWIDHEGFAVTRSVKTCSAIDQRLVGR